MHGMLNTMCGPDDEHSLDLVRQPDLVRASRKSGGSAAEGSTMSPVHHEKYTFSK